MKRRGIDDQGLPTVGGAGPTSASLADDFHPFDLDSPFAFYARARAEAPVFYSADLDF